MHALAVELRPGTEGQVAEAVEPAWPGRRAGSTSAGCSSATSSSSSSARGSSAGLGDDGVADLPVAPGKRPGADGRADLDALHATVEQDGQRADRGPQRGVPVDGRHGRSVDEMRADLQGGLAQAAAAAVRGIRRGQCEEAIVGDALGTLEEGPAGDDREVVAQARQRARARPEQAGMVALGLLGRLATAHDDGVEGLVEAGLAEGDEVRLGAVEALRDVPAGAREGALQEQPGLGRGGHEAGARCAPRAHLETRPVPPALHGPGHRGVDPGDTPGQVLEQHLRLDAGRHRGRGEHAVAALDRGHERGCGGGRAAIEREEGRGVPGHSVDGSRVAAFRRRGRPLPRAPRAGR